MLRNNFGAIENGFKNGLCELGKTKTLLDFVIEDRNKDHMKMKKHRDELAAVERTIVARVNALVPTCPICLETYHLLCTRIFPTCGHTVCTVCMDRMIANGRQEEENLQCPTCRVPCRREMDIPRNWELEDFIHGDIPTVLSLFNQKPNTPPTPHSTSTTLFPQLSHSLFNQKQNVMKINFFENKTQLFIIVIIFVNTTKF